jgi:hypothetical protein
MPRAIPSPSIPFTIAVAIAMLVTQPSAASPSPPPAAAPVDARIVPIDQVVSLSNPGVALVRPADGRLRGYGFSAVITGVTAVDSAGPTSAPIFAGPHRHLVVFSLNLTTYPAPDGLGAGTAPPLRADVALASGYLPFETNQLRSNGQATYVVSVPDHSGDVDLEMTAADLTSSFSLTTLHRVGTQPAVLYRDPVLSSLSIKVGQSVPVPVEVPDQGFSGQEIIGVTSATLTRFEPGDPAVQPSDPNDAYLAIVGTDGKDPDPPPGYLPGAHFVDGFSALAPTALTLTLPGGQTAAAAQSGSTLDGLLSGTYYFLVPADITSATLSVAPGTVSGDVYDVFTGMADNVTFTQPADFTLNFPPLPSAPLISTSTSTLPVVHNDPATGLAGVTSTVSGVKWLIPIGTTLLLGFGIALFRGRGRRRSRRSRASGRPHPYRPLVALSAQHRIDASSVLHSTALVALGPGPRPPGWQGSSGAGEASPPLSPPFIEGPSTSASPQRVSTNPIGARSTRSLELLVLGPVEVRGWKHRPRRRIVTALLCYLALHPGRPVSGDQLLSALWPIGSSRKEATRASLHTYVSDLRRALPEGMVPDAGGSDGYMLAGGIPTDWGTFVELVIEAKDAMPHDAAHLRYQALSLVRGAPFAGATSDMYEWVISEHHVAAMEVAITACAHALADWRLRTGDGDGAADAARIGLVAVNDSYVLHADMIRSTRVSGDPAALRRAWRSARSALGADGVSELLEELGGDAPLHGVS